MTCYLCGETRILYKFGDHRICHDCRCRMDLVRNSLKIGRQHWSAKEVMLEKLKLNVIKLADQIRR